MTHPNSSCSESRRCAACAALLLPARCCRAPDLAVVSERALRHSSGGPRTTGRKVLREPKEALRRPAENVLSVTSLPGDLVAKSV